MWGGGINSLPAGFCSVKSFCFPAADRQEISSPETHLSPPSLCREITPKRRGGSGIWGGPPPREQANRPWPSAGPGPGVPPRERLGEAGPGGRSPRRRSHPAPRCPTTGVPGGGAGVQRTPHFQRGERVLFPTHPASKKKKKKKKKDLNPTAENTWLGFFSPLACHLQGAEAPQAPLAAPPNPHPPAAGPDSSLLTICFSLGKVSGAILWPTHRGYICSKCWVASAGEALIPHHVQFPI